MWLALCLGGCLVWSQSATAQPPNGEQKGRSWAILIGVGKYHRANPLLYTVNDVRRLSHTLRTRGGYKEDHILEMTDEVSNPRRQPLRASLQAELPEWLKKPGPDDRILVYFSGHGFRDADGKMYLAPLDCDPANPAATGIPIQWFREQIAGCKAGFKLLVIDACHAGSEKGDEAATGIASNDLATPFQDLEGVVTLASSTAEQKSQIWFDKEQSLFSYWLNQGLKGHADQDGDGTVDVDELYKYVYRTVSHTAEARFPRPQTPVRIVRSGTLDVPPVIRLQPQSLQQVLADTAELLADAMDERRLGKVGVLEFTNDTRLGELLGADFGLLGRFCAEELERQLMDRGTGKFSVVDRRRLRKALSDQGFTIDDLGSTTALKQLSRQAGGMPVIVLGTLRSRVGRVVHLQCKLLQTASDELAGSAGGSACLNESEWAMLGRSVAVKPEDRRPQPPWGDQPDRPLEDQVIDRLDQRAQGPHPLLDPNFPFRVRMMIDGKERHGVFRGNDYLVPVRKGEVYELWIENRTDGIAKMRLLVDGLNTLPEKASNKGISMYLVGPSVADLDTARGYTLDPARSRVFRVRGFITETGTQGKLREFVVVDAAQSLAARRQFTEQIGLITAAFYAAAPSARGSLATGLGQERTEDLTERGGVGYGNLLGVVHIRYVDADTLQDAAQR